MYGSVSSLDFIRYCLSEMSERCKYDSVDDSNPVQLPPPTFLILARNLNNDDIIHQLRKEGQELASRYVHVVCFVYCLCRNLYIITKLPG